MGVASTQVSTSAHCASLHIEGRYVEVTLLLHLPVTLSLACFMGCSRLPLPSLLSLLGTLLMLSPQLLMVNAVDLFDVAVNGPEMQKAVISAVEQYNQDREDSANYFKLLRILDIKAQGIALIQYHMLVELVKTTCKKKMGEVRKYKKIEECKELPGNPEKKICNFIVLPDPQSGKMIVIQKSCG